MKTFKRIEEYIVDLSTMHLVNTKKGVVYQYDFDDMTVKTITPRSSPRNPIRYDETLECMMVWKNRNWQQISEGHDAIMFMFNSRIEAQLLND